MTDGGKTKGSETMVSKKGFQREWVRLSHQARGTHKEKSTKVVMKASLKEMKKGKKSMLVILRPLLWISH